MAARVHHWFTALTAILLALSGLAFFHPSLFFLTDLFGGPTWTRILHPWIGVIMTLSFLDLFVRFWRYNIWHPDDWVWIKNPRRWSATTRSGCPSCAATTPARRPCSGS